MFMTHSHDGTIPIPMLYVRMPREAYALSESNESALVACVDFTRGALAALQIAYRVHAVRPSRSSCDSLSKAVVNGIEKKSKKHASK